ncbi:MAG: single-stranded-DNA-specific exonuclease RecJ, partial [Opitutales bacterium]|nr:single-stranded-DNA-specific exonuclease RecJ [Opitutales bacterium]
MHPQKRWQHDPGSREESQRLESQLQVSRFLANLLVQRGLADPQQAETFLTPTLGSLTDPLLLTNLERAGNRILHAIRENERIHIIGDYDVDGVTSTTLLVSFLKRFGSLPHFVVPRRLEEGYGMSRKVIDRSL